MTFPVEFSPGAKQFAKFVVVGCMNVCVSFAVFVFLYRYFPLATFVLQATGRLGAWMGSELSLLGISSIDAGVANAIGYLAGMASSFMLNKHWTFQAGGLAGRQLRRFVILNLLVATGSTLLIFLLIDLLGAPYLPVWIGVTAVTLTVNFLVNKHWTFDESAGVEAAAGGASVNGRL